MTAGETKLLFPGLAGFYDSWRDLPIRSLVVVGYILLMHGWLKVGTFGLAGVSGFMAKQGLEPATMRCCGPQPAPFASSLACSRGFFAAALAVELGIVFLAVHLKAGFAADKGGFEYVLLLGIVVLAIAIRGGGPYSVDRMIGKEL